MPDLLAHALVGYAFGTLLSIRYDWLGPQYVTVLMVGAILPDLDKISLLVGDPVVEAWLDVPFTWGAIHLPAGSLLLCAAGALLAGDDHRIRVFGLLCLGAISHFALDALGVFLTGYSYPFLWPFSTYQFPAADLYRSSDRWPAMLAGVAAAGAYVLDRSKNG